MSSDAEVRFSTKVDNKGLVLGMRNAGRELDCLTRNLERQNEAIEKQKATVAGLKAQYDKLVSGVVKPQSLIEFEKLLARNEKELAALNKEFDGLLERQEKLQEMAAFDISMRGVASPETTAELDKIDKQMEALGNSIRNADEKSLALKSGIEKIKLDPTTSIEAQKLAGEIELAGNRLERLTNEAAATENQIKQTMDKSRITAPIRDIKSEVEKLTESIKKQAEEQKAVQTLFEKSKAALVSAKEKGDALAKSVAQSNVDKALHELKSFEAKSHDLYYNTERLKSVFEQLSNTPLAETLEGTRAEMSALTFILDDAAKNAKNLSSEIYRIADEAKPPEIEKPLTGFIREATIAQSNISDMENKIKELNAQLESEKEPSTIIALQYELQATQQSLEALKSSLSKPVSDIIAVKQLQEDIGRVGVELGYAREEYYRLYDELRTVKNPLSIIALQEEAAQALAKMKALENEYSSLQNKLGDVKHAGIEAVADSADETTKALERVKSALADVARGIASSLGKIPSFAVKGVKAIASLIAGMKLFGKHTRQSGNAVTDFGRRIKNLVVAAFAFNVIRRGLTALRNYLGGLLKTNAEFAASLNAIKVNLATAFQPIYDAILPALNALMSALATATAYIAAFISMLFGKTYSESKAAAKALNEQAEALKKTGGAAKSASKQLQSFDQINQQVTDTAGGGASVEGISALFEDVGEPDIQTGWIGKFTDDLHRIMDVFKHAWDEYGEPLVGAFERAVSEIKLLLSTVWDTFVLAWEDYGKPVVGAFLLLITNVLNIIAEIAEAFSNAWQSDGRGESLIQSYLVTLESIINLINSIAEAFREAWNDGTGESILGNILQIATNINNIISNIANGLREAWEANNNGIAIWNSVLGIVDSITACIERVTSATADWAKALDFEPAISSIRTAFEKLEPVVSEITDAFSWMYEEILLPFGKWIIETAFPAIMDNLITPLLDLADTALDVVVPAFKDLWEKILKPIVEWIQDAFIFIIEKLGGIFKKVADTIRENSGELGEAFNKLGYILKIIWEEIAKPILDTALSVVGDVFDTIGNIISGVISGIIQVFSGLMDFITGVFTGDWDKAWEGIKGIFKGVFNSIVAILEGAINLIIHGINGLIGLLNKISFDIPETPFSKAFTFGINIPKIPELQIPRLATGGIIDSATIAMIGERGREAVLPLDSNTGWMDTLAAKIANLVGQTIAVSLSSTGANSNQSGDVIFDIDGVRVARAAAPALIDELRRLGLMPT